MDPDENLTRQRLLREKIVSGRNSIGRPLAEDELRECVADLCELSEALDIWLAKGGFLPAAWRSKTR